MGSFTLFLVSVSPRSDTCDDRLTAVIDGHVLNSHLQLAQEMENAA
jgi:hypothetical protein